MSMSSGSEGSMDFLLYPEKNGETVETEACVHILNIARTQWGKVSRLSCPTQVRWTAFWQLMPYEVLIAIIRTHGMPNHPFSRVLIECATRAKAIEAGGAQYLNPLAEDIVEDAINRVWVRCLLELEKRHHYLTELLVVNDDPFADDELMILPLAEIPFSPDNLLENLEAIFSGDEDIWGEELPYDSPFLDDGDESDEDEDDGDGEEVTTH